jgi:hypothetical protein
MTAAMRAVGHVLWRHRVDVAQTVLLLIGWIVAFVLGKELQSGFSQWQMTRRRESSRLE